MIKWFQKFFVLSLTALLFACGGSVIPPNPLNKLKDKYKDAYRYTIILNDMDLNEDQYQHKYKVMTIQKDGTVDFEYTDWQNVDDYTFAQQEPNLGMEILSKDEKGRCNNLATPPGFTFIINDSHYGFWDGIDVDDLSLDQVNWKFHPPYKELQHQLELDKVDISYEEYNQFKNKFAYIRPFYGEKYHKDSTKYGTYSRHWIIMRPLFYQRRLNKRYFNKTTSGAGGGNRGGGGFGK